jgi:hypothetical protein
VLGSAGRARLRYAREGGGGGRQLGRVLNDECANERRVGPTRSSSRTGGTYRLSRRPACIGGPIAPLAGPGRHTSRRVRRLSRPQSVSKDLHPPAEAPRSQNFNDRFQSRENKSQVPLSSQRRGSYRAMVASIPEWREKHPADMSYAATYSDAYPDLPQCAVSDITGVRSASSEGLRLPRWRPAPRGPPRSLRRGR